MTDGTYQGRAVAIKCFDVNGRNSDRVFKVHFIYVPTRCRSALSQGFCREVVAWKHLSHQNILPLLGVSISPDAPRLCILTEWMNNGNVMQYARSNPNANRLQLVSPLAGSLWSVSCLSRTVAFSGHVCCRLPSWPQDRPRGSKRSAPDILETLLPSLTGETGEHPCRRQRLRSPRRFRSYGRDRSKCFPFGNG